MEPTKYEIVPNKFITMEKILESPSSQGETQNFMEHWWKFGYKFYSTIPIDDKFLMYATDKQCLLNWLEKLGYIKKPFQPFTIEIPVSFA